MKKIITITLLGIHLLFSTLSCSEKQEESDKPHSNQYIDSLSFKYYRKSIKPYLVKSTTYAYNDSMSKVLDTLDLALLERMNLIDVSYGSPLSYKRYSDTLAVDIIYSRGWPGFGFGEIKTAHDSIFICISGDVYKPLPELSDRFNVPYRFYRNQFKLVVDSAVNYSIFIRDVENLK